MVLGVWGGIQCDMVWLDGQGEGAKDGRDSWSTGLGQVLGRGVCTRQRTSCQMSGANDRGWVLEESQCVKQLPLCSVCHAVYIWCLPNPPAGVTALLSYYAACTLRCMGLLPAVAVAAFFCPTDT